MFNFMAVLHFLASNRTDLVRMVPSMLPAPALLVALTGVLQLAGAVGLLTSATVVASALTLGALLVALLPANVRAARAGLQVGERRTTRLRWRIPIQLFWIGSLLWIAADSARRA